MGKINKKDDLSDLKRIWVNTYPLTYNVSETARKMGISENRGHIYMKDPIVKKALLETQHRIAQKCEITMEECMNELRRIAFFDHRSYLENFKVNPESGKYGAELKDFDEIDTRALQEILVR